MLTKHTVEIIKKRANSKGWQQDIQDCKNAPQQKPRNLFLLMMKK